MIFELNEEQKEKLNTWIRSKAVVYEGAIGGRYSFCFTPNSLGQVVTVTDIIKKDTLDLTDYDSW
jgi:hypothetical protein